MVWTFQYADILISLPFHCQKYVFRVAIVTQRGQKRLNFLRQKCGNLIINTQKQEKITGFLINPVILIWCARRDLNPQE